ncbi:MAG TPA: hypothetical protein DEG71_01170 [Clostridiales bacterium]|nr:hypothetical protein [Clostridiales bacterium]
MARGIQKGQIIERKEKPKGYITISDTIRVRVETDCLIWEEVTGKNKDTQELTYGNNHYFTSWKGLLDYLVRRATTDKIANSGTLSFTEGRKVILEAINEVRELLLGEINNQMIDASNDIKTNINNFNI